MLYFQFILINFYSSNLTYFTCQDSILKELFAGVIALVDLLHISSPNSNWDQKNGCTKTQLSVQKLKEDHCHINSLQRSCWPGRTQDISAVKFSLGTLPVGIAVCKKAYPRVLNMYFEGCLGFNVIQQSGLMSRVFVGSLPITLDYGSPKCFH